MLIELIRLREELYQKYTALAKKSSEDFLAGAQELRPTNEERQAVIEHDMQQLAYDPDELEDAPVEPSDGSIIDDPLWNVPEDEWPEHMRQRAARVRVIKAAAQWDVETQLEIAQAKYGRDLFDGGALLWRLPAAEQQKEIERLTKRSEDEPLRRVYNRHKAQNPNLYYAFTNMKKFADEIADKRDTGLLPDFSGTSIAPQFTGVLTGWIAFVDWSLPKLDEFGYKPTTDGMNPSFWRYRLFRHNKNIGYLPENMGWAPARRNFR